VREEDDEENAEGRRKMRERRRREGEKGLKDVKSLKSGKGAAFHTLPALRTLLPFAVLSAPSSSSVPPRSD
jgi:hypothetical protein